MATPEQKIKAELKRYIESIGGYWASITGGPYSKPGDPDMVACIKGRFVAIEGKVPNAKLRPAQEERKLQIEDADGIYLVIHSRDELETELRSRGLG